MNKKKIYDLVVNILESIQEVSGREKISINENTVPIGQLPGFDSMNGIEFSIMISEHIPMEKSIQLCVSDDGKEALSVRQIIDRLVKLWSTTHGEK